MYGGGIGVKKKWGWSANKFPDSFVFSCDKFVFPYVLLAMAETHHPLPPPHTSMRPFMGYQTFQQRLRIYNAFSSIRARENPESEISETTDMWADFPKKVLDPRTDKAATHSLTSAQCLIFNYFRSVALCAIPMQTCNLANSCSKRKCVWFQ